jgi:DNA-binding MarR family transcriptional regulator
MPGETKKLLEKIAGERAPGPAPTFSVLHVLRAIELVSEKSVGRARLAEELKVGEGAVRTIVNRLKKAKLLLTSKTGCQLTLKGQKLLEECKKIFGKRAKIEETELMSTPFNFAILAKKCGDKVKFGLEQRDAAVKAGAKGATTIIFKSGRLVIPSVSDDLSRDYPKTAERLLSLLQPEENDVIVVAGADSLELAEYGAAAAIWTFFDDC